MWIPIALEVLREFIDDVDGNTYQDCRLEKLLNISALKVLSEVTFSSGYTINMGTWEVSPSPATDTNFILLVSLKAACRLAQNELKTNAGCAIKVVDGPSTIDTSNRMKSFEATSKSACETYEEAKREFVQSNTIGEAVLGPYSPGYKSFYGYQE